MDYLTIEQARGRSGLRLVLTGGTPAPWSEAAKAVFRYKGLDYLPVRQDPGGENAELIEWTGQGGAPVAILDEEKPVSDSLEILLLAERLAPMPALVPDDVGQRIETLGISREIVGRSGLGWSRRLMILRDAVDSGQAPPPLSRVARRHDYSAEEAARAEDRTAAIIAFLSTRLTEQKRAGSPYFVGSAVTAADIYWAAFSIMFAPLDDEICRMTPERRERFQNIGPKISRSLATILIDHRDHIFSDIIGTPLDF